MPDRVPVLAGLALAHGYHPAFWWTAGVFAAGAVAAGILFRRGPLHQRSAAPGSPAVDLASSPASVPGHRMDRR